MFSVNSIDRKRYVKSLFLMVIERFLDQIDLISALSLLTLLTAFGRIPIVTIFLDSFCSPLE